MLRILHTSDWHLGHTWNGRSRQAEFAALLDWLLDRLVEEKVDVLLVAGDIFDSGMPTPTVQAMYYDFLRRVRTVCRLVVLVAGNHDSPSLLDAPRDLLGQLNVHVVGAAEDYAGGEPDREIVVLRADDGEPELIIGAVPFLRDRDLRRLAGGESIEEREKQGVEGIRKHYAAVCDKAETIRGDRPVPLVVSGHLFVAGGATSEGVREVHVGTLGQLGGDLFPGGIDYLALGHLHLPQRVAGSASRRYSGSPLPMSFGEAEQEKTVLLVEFDGRRPAVRPIPVPPLSRLARIEGTLDEIKRALTDLSATLDDADPETLVEIVYTGMESLPDLPTEIERHVATLSDRLDVLRIRNDRVLDRVRLRSAAGESLDDLTPGDVFRRLLEEVKTKNKADFGDLEPRLIEAYEGVVRAVLEEQNDRSTTDPS